jgi:hypothetical protein
MCRAVRVNVAVPMLLVLPLLAGCGRSDRPRLAPVAGTVDYQGKPLAQGWILFVPEHGHSALARIVAGRIVEASTFDANDGVPVGRHRVQIASYAHEPRGMELVPWVIPQRYGDVKTSGLTAEIMAGAKNHLQFALHD